MKFPINAWRMNVAHDAEPLYSLQILVLIASPHIVDTKAVAYIIFTILPQVHYISGSNQMWQKVNKYLKLFRVFRYLNEVDSYTLN